MKTDKVFVAQNLCTMKIFVFIVIFFLCFAANGQVETKNFSIQNGDLIWQKVFDTNLTFDKFSSYFKTSGIFEKMEVDSLIISGELRQLDADYKGAGYTAFNVPVLITNTHITAFVLIEFKADRYRVTISKILLTDAYNAGILLQMGQKTFLNEYAIKKGELKDSFQKSPIIIYNHTFINLFELKEKKKDDW